MADGQAVSGQSQGDSANNAQGAGSQQSQSGGGNASAQGANSQNQNNGNVQGNNSNDLVSQLQNQLTQLNTKLESVISDNAKYRERIRRLAADDGDDSGNSGGKGGQNNESAEILQELRKERALNRLSSSATKAGFVTPDLILNFVNLDEVSDKKGNVKEPDKVIENLKSQYPTLFKPVQSGNGDGNAGGGNRGGNSANDMNAAIRAKARGN